MANETYLIVSYFAASVFCLALGLFAYLWLRRPTEEIADSLPHKNWRKIIRKGFPLSMVLFVLAEGLSVDYYGCGQKKYQGIVNDRSYITRKNAEQVSEALQGVIWSVALWSVLLAIALRAARRPSPK
ncbi:MAG TPA: hypothetical protein VGR55_12215 [Candidatus Acidoferrum sp.]|nr:hypothetical protein [Candidatus Acidoferrum sp.]